VHIDGDQDQRITGKTKTGISVLVF